MLAKQGVDPLRHSGVREALKRLVKDSIDGLTSRYFKPVVVSLLYFMLMLSFFYLEPPTQQLRFV